MLHLNTIDTFYSIRAIMLHLNTIDTFYSIRAIMLHKNTFTGSASTSLTNCLLMFSVITKWHFVSVIMSKDKLCVHSPTGPSSLSVFARVR